MCPELVLVSLIVNAAWQQPVETAPRPSALQDVLLGLQERNSSIQTIACTYSVKEHNLSGADSGSADNAFIAKFDETRDRWFRLEITTLDVEGNAKGRRTLMCNGKEFYHIRYYEFGPDAAPPTVTVGVENELRGRYEAEAMLRQFLGDAILPPGGNPYIETRALYDQLNLAEKAEDPSPAILAGRVCKVVRWSYILENNRLRRTAWLDPGRDLVMLRLEQEMQRGGEGNWSKIRVVDVKDVASTSYPSGDKKTKLYWYPRRIMASYFNNNGVEVMGATYEVISCRINARMSRALFTPDIEDGSNVIDRRTGKGYVYGRKPSQRLSNLVDRRVRESKKAAEVFAPDNASHEISPPNDWGDYASWVVSAIGVIGLLLAGIFRWRRYAPRTASSRRGASGN